MRYRDLSVGRRLGTGFGLLLITLVGLVVAVAGWQADSAREQRAFMEHSAPLSTHADELERSILYLAISVRAYLLSPQPEQARRYHERVERTQRALAELRDHPKDPDSERLYSRVDLAVQAYLAEAEDVVRAAAQRRIDPSAAEASLVGTRERTLLQVREFAQLQDEKAKQSLAAMAQARDRTAQGLAMAFAVALFLSLIVAFLTTQSIRRPTRELLGMARALTTGDLKPALQWAPPGDSGHDFPAPRSEMLQLAHAFGAAAVALQRREQRLRAHREVASTVASSLDRHRIAAGALRVMAEHVGAAAGVLYWKVEHSDELLPLAVWGVDEPQPSLRVGEGIPGEAVRSRRLVTSRDVPAGMLSTLKLGYDAAPPRAAAGIPILSQDKVLGVILVATFDDFDDDALAFLEAVGPEVGVGLQNARAYEEIRELLAQVQEKNERIEQQNEELQTQNEEIQSQHEEIQAQHEEIQSQSDELQRQNDQLRQHAEALNERAAMLSQADERKNEFLGFLAHELRNPTSAIANGLFVLERVDPGSDMARNAQAIMQRQTRQLTRLIDDLLDTTRISRGKIELDRDTLNFIEVARECLADHQSVIEARRIALDVQVPGEEVWVSGDRTRLCQIIGNLLSNAIKFSEDGARVSITVSMHRASRSLELRVSDTGCGIEPGLLPLLFTPFTQGTTSLARTKGGLGLGLALVKSLVELHDGSVSAYSDGPGRGSSFVVRLPLADPPRRTAPRPVVAPRAWRVLIVEDNRDAADSLRAGAELQGYDVRVAYDGNACLEMARFFRPQVVLCDIGLPGIDGYEVARRLRADPTLDDMYIIAVSGYAAPRDKARAVAAGFDYHVAKPLNMDDLETVLSELEGASRAVAPGTSGRA